MHKAMNLGHFLDAMVLVTIVYLTIATYDQCTFNYVLCIIEPL